MQTQRKTAIVLLTYNNLAYNQDCIGSIRRYTAPGTYELIVVDNASADGTREWLSEQPDLTLRLNDENAGFPAGCNMGIALAGKDSDILLLNNDTVVTENWLDNLRACLYSAPDIGAAGAVSRHNENLQGLDLAYDTLEQMQERAALNNRSDNRRWEEKAFLIGFCLLIRREALEKAGPLDEAYSPGYVEDNDYCLRILFAGYRLMLCHDCFVHHYLGSEFRKDLSAFYPVLRRNRALFEGRWGFSTVAFDDIKFASLRMYQEGAHDPPERILTLNCGIGVTLLKLKFAYPGAKLYGVEPDAAMARVASRFAQVCAAPADSFPLPCGELFDCIFLGDSLEKTPDPEALLKSLLPRLAEGGQIVGEVQNIAHYAVLKNLLGGAFLFGQDLLSRGKRAYFAREDLYELARRCGCAPPHIFHWYSVSGEEEARFIADLSGLAGADRAYLYKTHLFAFRLEK